MFVLGSWLRVAPSTAREFPLHPEICIFTADDPNRAPVMLVCLVGTPLLSETLDPAAALMPPPGLTFGLCSTFR